MKITDDVIKLDCSKGAYVYAVTGKEGVTLIDTGMPGWGEAILAELAANSIKPGDIKQILLTHHDIDHIGNTAFLQEKTGCRIFIHALDYPYVMEGKKREGIKGLFGAMMKSQKPKEVTRIEGDKIGEFAVLPAPGHTRGHTVYRFRNVLFLGDLVRSSDGKFSKSPSIMTWNKGLQAASIMNLAVTGAEWFCMAHGEPLGPEGWDSFVKSFG